MRIAAFVHLFRTLLSRQPTGVGKHINNMVPRLAAQAGVELSVVAGRDELENGAIPRDSPLHGLRLTPLGWQRKNAEIFWSFLNWPKVERWTGDIDWVYCPAEAYVAARKASRAITVHCVNWFEPELPWHGDADVVRARRGLGPRFRRFKDVELILPVSQFLAGRLTALFGVSPEHMRIVGNGVEESYFNAGSLPDQWARIAADRPYLIVVGGLTRRKGGECILAVARELLQRKSDLRILVAGGNEPQFDAPAKELANIEMLGYVSVDTGLPALLRASVALLFPSRYETFGIPAAEAMAAGTPAVVAHYAALPEVVGEAGVVVDVQKPAAIADVLMNLQRDAALRMKHVEAGRQRAQQFRWEACAERVLSAMREKERRG